VLLKAEYEKFSRLHDEFDEIYSKKVEPLIAEA
jgi:hypothetical protein